MLRGRLQLKRDAHNKGVPLMGDSNSPLIGPRTTRRELLRFLGIGAAVIGVSAACQSAAPAAAPTAAPAQPTAPSGGAPTAAPAATQAAPAQQAAPAPSTATFRIAIGVDPDTLDPAGQTTTTVQNIVDYMVETLVAMDESGKIVPQLAEKWEGSADGKTYTFTLRKGVKFHDGTDFNADAVKTAWERILNPNLQVPLRAPFDKNLVDTITAVDPSTLKVQLKTSFAPFVAMLAQSPLGIISPDTAKKFPEKYNEEPVGTGPYKFKERRKGESLTLDRFDGYWGKKPYYGSVQFRVVPEGPTRESLILANQVEMIILPPVSDLPALKSNPNVNVLLAQSNRTIYVAMDLTLPGGTPLGDKKIRQALNYAVDKEGIIKSILFGAASPMDAPCAPAEFGYAKQGMYAYDPNKAKQLLQDAGKPTLNLKFLYPTGRYVQDAQAAQAIAGNLRDVGITTDAVTSDWPTYLAQINVASDKGSSNMHMLGWAPGYMDAYQQMVQFSKKTWPPAGLATAHYTNPDVETALDQAATEPNADKRQQLYAQAQKIVWDDAPWIFLWVQSFPIVYSKKVSGVGALPNEKFAAVYAQPA